MILVLLGLVISINVDSKLLIYANLNNFVFDKLNGQQCAIEFLLLLIQLE